MAVRALIIAECCHHARPSRSLYLSALIGSNSDYSQDIKLSYQHYSLCLQPRFIYAEHLY